MSIYDTHAHPNLEPLLIKTDEIIKDCKENDLYLNVVGTDLISSAKAISLAKKYPKWLKACIAIHPNDVQNFDFEKSKEALMSMCKENLNHIVAIGECGLDFYYTTQYKKLQYEYLIMQMDIAVNFNLPLMLHVRNAYKEIIDFLKTYKPNVPIIIHCFSGNLEDANALLKLKNEFKIFLSIPGIVTFKNAINLQKAIEVIPLENLLVETDSPWLAPMPFRGQENKPLYVKKTIEKIAQLKNLSYETIANCTFKNASQLFLKI